jgi:transcriptional regulator with XRE-family HTH domain
MLYDVRYGKRSFTMVNKARPPASAPSEPISHEVAARLRRLRRAQGLSLEELAVRADVSRAMLSQIETLKANPTVALLWKVARGLDVPFAELLGGAAPPPTTRLSRARDARYLYSADHRFRSRPLLAQVPGHPVELYELRFEAGAVESAEAHPAGSFEQMIVTAGRLRLTLPDGEHDLEPGDALLFAADVPHRYATRGKQACQGLSLILYRG